MLGPLMFEAVTIPNDLTARPPLQLQAAFHAAARAGAVIAPPHPVYGGRCDNPLVLALTQGLSQAGVAVLRFNFRGTGGSTGEASDDPTCADSDYRAATAYLASRQAGPYLAAGYSFGAASALRVAACNEQFRRLVLIGPPLGMLDVAALTALRRPVSIIVGDDDEYAPLEPLQALLAKLSHVELHVIAGADHFFSSTNLDQIRTLGEQAGTLLLGAITM